MSVYKERVTLTLTKPYLDGMDRLRREGIYMERAEVIRDALRLLLEVRGIPPFYPEVRG
uniref:Putative ribbon-helix-helix protein repressor n=1 Tax=viral metagenome TaxID=1070528 RepID=A0A6M3M1J9_9ZZZZ